MKRIVKIALAMVITVTLGALGVSNIQAQEDEGVEMQSYVEYILEEVEVTEDLKSEADAIMETLNEEDRQTVRSVISYKDRNLRTAEEEALLQSARESLAERDKSSEMTVYFIMLGIGVITLITGIIIDERNDENSLSIKLQSRSIATTIGIVFTIAGLLMVMVGLIF